MKLNFYLFLLITITGFPMLGADAEKKVEASARFDTNQAELKQDAEKNVLKDELVRNEILNAIPELPQVLAPLITDYLFNVVSFNEVLPEFSVSQHSEPRGLIRRAPDELLTKGASLALFLTHAQNGDCEKMQKLIEEDEDIVHTLSEDGKSAYDLASKEYEKSRYAWSDSAEVLKKMEGQYKACLDLLRQHGVGHYVGEIETEDGIIKICYQF